MSMSRWFEVCENTKTKHVIDAMFFGPTEVFDYKTISEHIFNTYEDAMSYIRNKKLSLKDVHVRAIYDFGGGCSHTDYIYKIGRKK